jgi:glycosyltransferase involved in cell wall biosynthesis
MPQSYRIQDVLLHDYVDGLLERIEEQTELTWPIYIPSRHRPEQRITTKQLDNDNIDYKLVVEPHDYKNYAANYPADRLLKLPKDNQGISYSRNYIIDHAKDHGYQYCWQFDDDLTSFDYRIKGKRYKTGPRPLISIIEQVINRYDNIGGANIANAAFNYSQDGKAPVVYNAQIYCAQIFRTDITSRFRPDVAEDTDMSLQILAEGWVTLVFKRFGFFAQTSGQPGGNTENEYADNGRLLRFQKLLEYWPGSFNIGYHNDGRAHIISRNYYSRFKQRPHPKPNPEPEKNNAK